MARGSGGAPDWSKISQPVMEFIEHNTRVPFQWSVTRAAQVKLAKLCPEHGFDFAGKDSHEINRRLRSVLAPRLGRDDEVSHNLAVWVIQDWGRIPTRPASQIIGWKNALGRGSDRHLETFVADRLKEGGDGVSSWSKLLAFMAPSKHAISDARTTLALNIALDRTLGDDARLFSMRSPSRRPAVRQLPLRLRSRKNPLDYRDYLDFLQTAKELTTEQDILSVEMKLFAAGPELIEKYLAGKLD